MTQSTKLAVFDLDDTLYREMEYVASGFKAVAEYLRGRFGRAGDFFGAMEEAFRAGNRANVFNTALQKMGLSADTQLIAELVTVYRTHKPTIRPFAGVPRVLELVGQRFHLGMLTDGHSQVQRNKVKALCIARYFDRILYTDEHGKNWWKPSCLGFEELQQSFGVGGTCCVYVADNPLKDFYAPNQMGWLTVRVRSKDGLYSNLEASGDYKARFEVEEIGQVIPILENWNAR